MSDKVFKRHLRNHYETMYHLAATCRMGNDDRTALDPRLSIRNVSGLRAISASVTPLNCSANTVAASMMIGETGADITLEGGF